MREDKVSGLTCYTGRTSHSGGHQSSDIQHMYCTAHRPPQELEPPKQEEQFNSSKNVATFILTSFLIYSKSVKSLESSRSPVMFMNILSNLDYNQFYIIKINVAHLCPHCVIFSGHPDRKHGKMVKQK